MVAVAALPGLGIALSLRMEERLVEAPISAEAALARSAVRGDKRAFGKLVDLHKRAVFGLCLRLLRETEEAKDAAQESFARAYAALESYDASQPFAPWVLRIARNHCLDVLRRRLPASRQVALDARAEGEGGAPPRELADVDAPRADEALERRELAATLAAAVAALPPNYREVVHLFHVEHLSYKEIAATLDVPIGTVMTWLHRARAKLRAGLAESDPEVTP
jgi:RNA polymerase sigma-70 factor, ECF subfamily